jgi:5,5'-dehydrodivanillate O-demethylase
MRRFWHPVLKSEDLKSGRAKPIKLMSEDFTLYRGESGTPHLVAFRCPHRGTQLSLGYIEGDCLRCMFHGWMFDSAGQCVDQPAELESFAKEVSIKSWPTQEYLGLIFVYIGEGEPPPLPRYPEYETPGLPMSMDAAPRPCNWINNLDNSLDQVHAVFVHPGLTKNLNIEMAKMGMEVEENDWGIMLTIEMPGGHHAITHYGMPNLVRLEFGPSAQDILEIPGKRQRLLWKVPVDDERHIRYMLTAAECAPEDRERWKDRMEAMTSKWVHDLSPIVNDVIAGKLKVEDIDRDLCDWTALEDDLAQCGQGVIWDRKNETLGRSDVGLVLQRKIWARELKALDQDQPLKEWTYDRERLPLGVFE